MNDFELNQIRKMQETSMLDQCKIDKYSESYDSYRSLQKVWTSGSMSGSSICGFKSNTASKSYGETEIRLKYAAIFRLPLNSNVTTQDKLSLTYISGSPITPIQYQIATIENGHQIIIVGADLVKV